MSSDHAKQRGDLAWGMLLMSCESGGLAALPESTRSGLIKIVRQYGDARYEQGRARESHIVAEREVERLGEEFARRRQRREVSR